MSGHPLTDRAEVARFVAWRRPDEGRPRRRINAEHLRFIDEWRARRQVLEAAWLAEDEEYGVELAVEEGFTR